MSTRAAAWLLFAAFALTETFPAIGPFGGLLPPVRHLILFGATAAVAATEGVAGPVPGILTMFAVEAGVSLAAAGLAALVGARILATRSRAARSAIVIA